MEHPQPRGPAARGAGRPDLGRPAPREFSYGAVVEPTRTTFVYRPCVSSMLVSGVRDDTGATARGRTYDVTPERFGQHIRALRRSRGLTQEQLAERSELSTDSIRRIEQGRLTPSLTTIAKLGRGLQANVSTIVAGVERRTLTADRELAEYLSTKSPRERALAWRVLRALFDEPR